MSNDKKSVVKRIDVDAEKVPAVTVVEVKSDITELQPLTSVPGTVPDIAASQQIWNEIKNKDLLLFSMTGQLVSAYFTPIQNNNSNVLVLKASLRHEVACKHLIDLVLNVYEVSAPALMNDGYYVSISLKNAKNQIQQPKVQTKVQLTSQQIWEGIKDLDLKTYSLPNQFVKNFFKPSDQSSEYSLVVTCDVRHMLSVLLLEDLLKNQFNFSLQQTNTSVVLTISAK